MQDKLRKCLNWVTSRWALLASIIGGTGLAVASILFSVYAAHPSWWHKGLLAVSLVLVAVGSYFVQRQVTSVTALQQTKRRLEEDKKNLEESLAESRRMYSAQFSDQLEDLANDVLHLDYTERVTIYKHRGNVFEVLGRYSLNPQYNQHGRQTYPDKQGCIGEAWKHKEAYDYNVPDPDEDLQKYYDHLRDRWGIPLEVASRLRMKPRNISAFTMSNYRGSEVLAIIVFESDRTGVLDHDQLREVVKTIRTKPITRFLEREQAFEPTSIDVRREGI